jgi:hypothetical protein
MALCDTAALITFVMLKTKQVHYINFQLNTESMHAMNFAPGLFRQLVRLVRLQLLHLSNTSFFVSVKEPACKRQKYIPLDIFIAFHCREYVPADNSSETIVATSLPIISNTFNETKDFEGRLKEIVVVGLNGFG